MPHPDTCHLRRQAVLAQIDGLPSMACAPFHPPVETVINLPLAPSTNGLYRSAGKKRVRTAQFNTWLLHAGYRLNAQRPSPVPGKVILLIEVERPKTKRKQDCTNRIKATEDLLVSHRIIEGDDQFCVQEVTARWADVAGVRVTIRSAP